MPILDWLNKGEAVRTAKQVEIPVPYRLLQGVKSLSYGDPASENMLIQGDNLEHSKWLSMMRINRGQTTFFSSQP
ncbi:MAG: hypothetical protein DIZ78_15930 [endosymbiont of Escarpia spicata]|uniref:Uncharacterized protein n=1 Tax=endosymbiont of Escarpia spicata TaxID=2200908 RepID=A0A370DC30_9GAMM|nr:MAG: hypothetical protein DIZ78_15930 [endosymbiont of Escarpia spicata]